MTQRNAATNHSASPGTGSRPGAAGVNGNGDSASGGARVAIQRSMSTPAAHVTQRMTGQMKVSCPVLHARLTYM